MDEILIEEKKYVSSKQAAKITGYAKDYIGQLCREGRVPARLVGRSWYVLESAINDHRFGDQDTGQEIKTGLPAQTWESPRYEAVSDDMSKPIPVNDKKEEKNTEDAQQLQDSWKAWFDRVIDTETSAVAAQEQEINEEEKPKAEEEAVNVPVHAVYRQPPEELLPRRHNDTIELRSIAERQSRKEGSRSGMITIQIAGAALAIVAVSFAVLGSGYFDKYLISNTQVGIIAGVALYNK